jgi:hypothetical protein
MHIKQTRAEYKGLNWKTILWAKGQVENCSAEMETILFIMKVLHNEK